MGRGQWLEGSGEEMGPCSSLQETWTLSDGGETLEGSEKGGAHRHILKDPSRLLGTEGRTLIRKQL